MPDVSGRSLEEVDRLFDSGIPLRKFKEAQLDELPQAAAPKVVDIESVVHVEGGQDNKGAE